MPMTEIVGRRAVRARLRECFYIWRYHPGEGYWLDRYETLDA